jgi:ABC-type uncharacterized transport system involved in gliding motility auxiliary subunit
MMRRYAANAFIFSLFLIIILSHFLRDIWVMGWPMYTVWAVCLVSALLWCVFSLDRLGAWIKKRSTQFALGLVFTGLGLLLIVSVVNWLASSNNKTWDLTANKIHSLSDQTQKVLKGLKEKVTIEVWSTSLKQMSGSLDMDRFFDNYRELGGDNIHVEIKNPIQDPTGAQKSKITRNNVIMIRGASGRETRIDTFSDTKAEEQVTNGIIQVIKGKRKTVCVTAGHKELEVGNTEADGFSAFKESLENSAYDVRDLMLVAMEAVPVYCEALVIPGPQTEPVEKEMKMLQNFIAAGGPTLVLFGVNTPRTWNKLLEPYGVSLNQDVIVDPRVQQPPLGVLTKNYSASVEIVKSFSQPVFFTFASSIKVPTKAPQDNIEVKSFISSESVTYAKAGNLNTLRGGMSRRPGDAQGPHAIAVLIEDKAHAKAPSEEDAHNGHSRFELFPSAYAQPAKAPAPVAASTAPTTTTNKGVRTIVFSNYHFAMNAIVQQFANMDILLSSINYLTGDADVMGIRPREAKQARLELTEKNIYQVRGYIILAACLFITLGVWATRRRRVA